MHNLPSAKITLTRIRTSFLTRAYIYNTPPPKFKIHFIYTPTAYSGYRRAHCAPFSGQKKLYLCACLN